jgi:hypothetical protein
MDYQDIIQTERSTAAAQQRRAGLRAVCRTDFRNDLPPEIDAAMKRIWKLGNLPNGSRDHVMGRLYYKISKGLACLTTADVIALSKWPDQRIKDRAQKLIDGKPLE